MAVLTIPQLKALWIDGFIPDENDYVDLFDTIEAIAGAATVALAENQIAFGDVNGDLTGDGAFNWDGDNLIIQGSGVDRFIRMAESAGAFNGGFIQMEGATNKFHLGVHDANDADPANDTKVITILRSNGNVGVGTQDPTEAFEVVGSIKVDGALIAPTFTNIPNRLAVVNPSFGSTRLGDSALQTPSLDVQVMNIKGANQETVTSFFVNGSGNTMTIRSGTSPVRVVDFASAVFDIATESGESTIANSIEDAGGGRYINDQGVQHYITNGSVVAQSSFQVLQNTGGLSRIKHWVGRYDGTTYDMAYEIDTNNVVNFEYPVKAPDGVAPDDLVTKAQLDAAGGAAPANMVTTDTAQTITGAKNFQGNLNVTGFLIAGGGVSGTNIEVKDSALPTGTQNNGAAALLKAGNGSGELVWLGKTGTGAMIFDNGAVTTARTYTMPDKNGTVAMLDDIPSAGTPFSLNFTSVVQSAGSSYQTFASGLVPANTLEIGDVLEADFAFDTSGAGINLPDVDFRIGFNGVYSEIDITETGGGSFMYSLNAKIQRINNTEFTIIFTLNTNSRTVDGMNSQILTSTIPFTSDLTLELQGRDLGSSGNLRMLSGFVRKK